MFVMTEYQVHRGGKSGKTRLKLSVYENKKNVRLQVVMFTEKAVTIFFLKLYSCNVRLSPNKTFILINNRFLDVNVQLLVIFIVYVIPVNSSLFSFNIIFVNVFTFFFFFVA